MANLDRIEDVRSLVVIDLEQRPDDFARRIASRGGTTSSSLWEICCASIFTLQLNQRFEVETALLESFCGDELEEPDILRTLDLRVARAAGPRTWLVTYDGRRHDVPVLQQRMTRWWQFDQRATLDLATARHLDVGVWAAGKPGKMPSLRDKCASVGISLAPTDRLERHGPAREKVKCELDVLGTAVLAFYALADEIRSVEPLANGLPSLGDALAPSCRDRTYISGFAQNPLLARPPGPWGHPTKHSLPWAVRQKTLPPVAREALAHMRPKGRC